MAFNPSFNMYRANKNGNGAASRLQLSKKTNARGYDEVLLFLEVAKQNGANDNGDAMFAWQGGKNSMDGGSVTIKLGTVDVGEILTVISGRKPCVGDPNGKFKGLFHQNAKGNSSLDFRVYAKDGQDVCYALSASKKVGDSEAVKVNHLVSFGEAETLRVFLNTALVQMNGWELDNQRISSPPKEDPQDQRQSASNPTQDDNPL